jgi:hypothetical protein
MSIPDGVINEIETRITTRDPAIHLLLAAAFQYLSISTGESFGVIFSKDLWLSYWISSGLVSILISCLLINEKFKLNKEEIEEIDVDSPEAYLNDSAVYAAKPVEYLLLIGYLVAIYQFITEIQTLGEIHITATMLGAALLFHSLLISATLGLMSGPWKNYVLLMGRIRDS